MCDSFFDHRVACAVSFRQHGNMSLSYGDTAYSLKNRETFLSPLEIDCRRLVCLKQVHANTIRYVIEDDCGSGALSYDSALDATDALITDCRGVPLVVLTADCLSIFLYDPLVPAIGVVHAGWRSTHAQIISQTVQAMQRHCQSEARSLRVLFGPAIQRCCYEVSREFEVYFPRSLRKVGTRYFLDLTQENKSQLLVAGVKAENISAENQCTFCTGDFFSYRKEGSGCGRMMSVIMLQ